MPFYGESTELKEITTAAELDFAPRRLLKAFILSRGLRHDDCIGMEALRGRAMEAFNAPRFSRVDRESTVEKIKRKDAEKKKQKELQKKRLEKERKEREELVKAKLITRKKSHSRSNSQKTIDMEVTKRKVNFDPKKGKLGIVLEPRSCTVGGIRENSQAYWAGVQSGWVIRMIQGAWVEANDVRPALKMAVTGEKKYAIDFDTYNAREKSPLPDANPAPVDHYPTARTSFRMSQEELKEALGIEEEQKVEEEAQVEEEILEPMGGIEDDAVVENDLREEETVDEQRKSMHREQSAEQVISDAQIPEPEDNLPVLSPRQSAEQIQQDVVVDKAEEVEVKLYSSTVESQ